MTARDSKTVIVKHVIRPKMSCQTMQVLKAMEIIKHVLASLKLSTLAAYVPTMLHHPTISQFHYHPLSSCVGLPLLSSCPPFSSYLMSISTVCKILLWFGTRPPPSPSAPFHVLITGIMSPTLLLPILSCEEGCTWLIYVGGPKIGSTMLLGS